MKTTKTIIATASLLLGLGACSATTTSSDGSNDNSGNPAGSITSAVPDEVKAIVDSECNSRPSPTRVNGVINGVSFNYTEVLSEQDEGNVISDGTSLLAKNIDGNLYVEPSTDGKVYWGARKWALAEDKAKADEAIKNVKITSTVSNSAANVIVDHPSEPFPGPRYQVCLVIKAPADWVHELENVAGILTSLDHAGPLS